MPAAGPFFWTELLTDDPDATCAWLAPALGWRRDGALLKAGDQAVARVMRLGDPEAAPHWLLHLAVPELAALCRRAAFLQGRVLLEPEVVADVGAGAVIADPMGCVLHPFELLPGHRATEPSGAAGTLVGALLYAPRVDLGARFYGTLLGWERKAGPGGVVWSADGRPIAAGVEAPKDSTAQWLPLFAVEDLDAAVACGDAVLLDPVELPGFGRVAAIEGPDGVGVALRGPTPPPAG
jgi:predicted enzyme related to lactoylglutathione lyase